MAGNGTSDASEDGEKRCRREKPKREAEESEDGKIHAKQIPSDVL